MERGAASGQILRTSPGQTSRTLLDVPEHSRTFPDVPGLSENVRECPEDVPGCPGGVRGGVREISGRYPGDIRELSGRSQNLTRATTTNPAEQRLHAGMFARRGVVNTYSVAKTILKEGPLRKAASLEGGSLEEGSFKRSSLARRFVEEGSLKGGCLEGSALEKRSLKSASLEGGSEEEGSFKTGSRREAPLRKAL